jgi:predicted amidohydrolase
MQEQLQVTIIQADLVWENKYENRLRFEQKIKAISSSDVVVLPEMFTTGFSMNPKTLAENMDGETVLWMKNLASEKNILLIGSIIIEENLNYYNRLITAFPDGTLQYYDKRHLFTLANEQQFYTVGTKQLLIEYRGWKLFPLVCYDLRFPVWARNTIDYDILIYIASWPKQRIAAWDALLKARAIENMAFTIGVNRVGVDANGFEYSGHSCIFDSVGAEILTTQEFLEETKSVIIKKSELNEIRKKLQFLNDRDSFTIL